MVEYKRKRRAKIKARQFVAPTIPGLPRGISVSFQHTNNGSTQRIKDGWWIVPSMDEDKPDEVLRPAEFAARFEVDSV